ncbi:hypothetical protein ACH4UR_25515 [Streptomyces lydicus]|uniref:hypothetical protein n=1 Tax=Streptomyces lydicus TaxID=47763 RepID=UPI003402CFCE
MPHTLTPPHPTTTRTSATELDRQVRRLYRLAYHANRRRRTLTNPNASAHAVTAAITRLARVLAAAERLLTMPGVAEHEETPYARSFLTAAERQLNAPSTRLLLIADAAHQAAAHADTADNDLHVIVFRDIEQHCRHLVDTAHVEPVLGRRGWPRRDHAASDHLQQQAAQWGLTSHTEHPTMPPHQPTDHPAVPTHLVRQAAERAAARARCAAGIRCTECHRTYGAVQVNLPGTWLCTDCIPTVNARLTARGYAPHVRPIDGGTPQHGPYTVHVWNGSGRGGVSLHCDTPQRAQFLAETERPFNNTGYTIYLADRTRE